MASTVPPQSVAAGTLVTHPQMIDQLTRHQLERQQKKDKQEQGDQDQEERQKRAGNKGIGQRSFDYSLQEDIAVAHCLLRIPAADTLPEIRGIKQANQLRIR